MPKHGKMSGRLFEQFLAQLVEHVRNVEEVAPEELSTAINAFQERARQMQILRDRQALKVTLLDLIEALPLEVSNEEVEQIVSNITQLL